VSNDLPKADVVIIGLGAVGGIVAHVLTQAGINVVGLEAGPRLDLSTFLANNDEISGVIRFWSGKPKYIHELPTWRPDAGSPTRPLPFPPIAMANMVGGTSVHYGAQSWRYLEDDFTTRTSTIKRYGEEVIPPTSTLTDWPITYDELEPYYDQLEYLIGVSGQAGNINGQMIAGGNPFEAPRSREFPMPPMQSFGYGELARKAMLNLGYHPFPQPAAIATVPYNERPPCTYCGYCQGFAVGTTPSPARSLRPSGALRRPADSRCNLSLGLCASSATIGARSPESSILMRGASSGYNRQGW